MTLVDDEGARSLPVFITVNVTRRNDVPELDVGVGFGMDDEVTFSEIEEGTNGVGIPIVSRPHRVQIRDEEKETQQITIKLRLVFHIIYSMFAVNLTVSVEQLAVVSSTHRNLCICGLHALSHLR